MDIESLYWQFCELELVRSQVEFSRVWLGRSGRYYSHLLAEDKQPGLATLIALRWRVSRLVAELPGGHLQDQLKSIDAALVEGIELRSILDIRTKRGSAAEIPPASPALNR